MFGLEDELQTEIKVQRERAEQAEAQVVVEAQRASNAENRAAELERILGSLISHGVIVPESMHWTAWVQLVDKPDKITLRFPASELLTLAEVAEGPHVD